MLWSNRPCKRGIDRRLDTAVRDGYSSLEARWRRIQPRKELRANEFFSNLSSSICIILDSSFFRCVVSVNRSGEESREELLRGCLTALGSLINSCAVRQVLVNLPSNSSAERADESTRRSEEEDERFLTKRYLL